MMQHNTLHLLMCPCPIGAHISFDNVQDNENLTTTTSFQFLRMNRCLFPSMVFHNHPFCSMVHHGTMMHPITWIIHCHIKGLRLCWENRNLQRKTQFRSCFVNIGGITYYVKPLAGPHKGISMPVRSVRVHITPQ